MKTLSRFFAAGVLALPTLAARAEAQVSIDFGAGLIARLSDPGSISRTHIPGLAGELSVSRAWSPSTRLRFDLGGSLFPGQSVAIPDCVVGGTCRTRRSLSHGAHLTAGLDRSLGPDAASPRFLAGAGMYWTAAGARDEADGKRSATAPGVNAGLSLGTGRFRLEGRGHLPVGDLEEVQALATVLVRIGLKSNR
jgi:hypothetical protein